MEFDVRTVEKVANGLPRSKTLADRAIRGMVEGPPPLLAINLGIEDG